MKRFIAKACAVCLMVASAATTAQAAEVLLTTWYGKFESETAFEKRLKELHPDVKFTYIDAQGNKSAFAEALRGTDMSKFDLVYSFGTTGTKLVKQFLDGKKPLVFNMVSAPVQSEIANSMTEPGNNLTGGQFLVDLELQMNVLSKLRNYKTLGVWFDPREKQGGLVVERIKQLAEKNGAKVVQFRIIPDADKIDELIDTASRESNKLDAVYLVGTTSFGKVLDKMHAKLDPKLLVMATAEAAVKSGSTIAMGPDNVERGKAVAELASRILKGEPAGKIPVSIVNEKNAVLYVNKSRMATVGLKDIDKLGLNIKYVE